MTSKAKTPAQLLKEAVFEVTDHEGFEGTYACRCPVTDPGDVCGVPDPDREGEWVRFYSPGWPTKAIAKDRLDQHLHEHVHPDELADDLDTFRAKHGLIANPDGRAAVFSAKDF